MRLVTALLSTVALLVASGCGATPGEGSGERGPGSSSASSAQQRPGHVVADGAKVRHQPFSYRIPRAWTGPTYRYDRMLATSHSADEVHTVTSIWVRDVFTESTPIDVYAPEAYAAARKDDPRTKRIPNVTVDGVEMYAFESVDRGRGTRTVEYGTAEGPYITRLIVVTGTGDLTAKQERGLRRSVLNSVRWTF